MTVGAKKTLVDKASAAGQADYNVNFERKVTMTYSGTQGANSTFTAFLVDSDGNEYPLSGMGVTGDMDLVTSAKPGEVVEYTKPARMILRIEWTKPSTGTVSAKAILT